MTDAPADIVHRLRAALICVPDRIAELLLDAANEIVLLRGEVARQRFSQEVTEFPQQSKGVAVRASNQGSDQ